jgi:hypothetical protein
MSSQNTKTTNATEGNDVPRAADAGATSPSDGTGRKLRWTSLKAAAGIAHRTKKSKTKKANTSKTESIKAKKAADRAGKLSALDAAAKVLQETGLPMNCQDMIQAMAAKGYWTSPAGKTPSATLYSAIAREIQTKASQARFHKTDRGQFSYQTPQAP